MSRIAFHMKRGQMRLGLLVDSGDNGVDAVAPAQHGREQDFALNARPNSFCCFTWINGVDLRYGSTADQGRTGREDSSSRLWHPARAPGTHAKQGPSTGHSAVGLRQAGKMSPDAEATFHRASCTPGNQVFVLRTALLFLRSAVRLVYAELPGPVAACLMHAELDAVGNH